jgi:hypothetical protein
VWGRVGVAVAAIAGFAAVSLAQMQVLSPKLAAEQIVAKNVAARGGLDAWRKITTMVWVGHIESAHAPTPSVLFVLQQQRPNRTRFEINAMGERTLRIFDGAQGWRVRPARSDGPDVQPYTTEELRFARGAQGIDGPLIDYATKGNLVTLEGLDEIEGHKAYRLSVRLSSGESDRVWVDTRTFLDLRYDRIEEGVAGLPRRVVSVFYRDYKTYGGLQIPSIIETGTGPSSTPDRMVIEKVVLNPPLDQRTFANPDTARPRNAKRFNPAPQSGVPVVPPNPLRSGSPAPAPERDAGSAPQ